MARSSPSRWTFWRAVIWWRLGAVHVALYAAIFAAIGVGFYMIARQQQVTCRRQNTGAAIIHDLVRATRPAVVNNVRLRAAFDRTLHELKQRRC